MNIKWISKNLQTLVLRDFPLSSSCQWSCDFCAVCFLGSHWVFGCSGRLCEASLSPPSGCELLLCENGAPCVESDGTAVCQCLSGFGGPSCEKLLSVNFIDRDSYLLLSDVKNWPQTNITLQVQLTVHYITEIIRSLWK